MYDVLIIGGGPSGSALAALLSKKGLKTCIVEKSKFSKPRLGDFLPPEAKKYLPDPDPGLYLNSDCCSEVNEFLSCWGSDELQSRNFFFNLYGSGSSLNRARFDKVLFDLAADSGAKAYVETAVVNVEEEEDAAWRITCSAVNKSQVLHAKYLVVACGRGKNKLFDLPVTKYVYDNLFGLALQVPCELQDNRPLIEACPDGWFYSNQIDTTTSILLWMSDTDLKTRFNVCDRMLKHLDTSIYTQRRFKPHQNRLRAASVIGDMAITSATRPVYGKNWCLTGDCAQSFDPLSSHGIYNALKSANILAQALVAEAHLRDELINNYSAMLEKDFRKYLEQRKLFYSMEQRWQNNLFWSRRI